MTEAEWATATDPMPLLRHLNADRLGRKYLLYLVAGCRHLRPLFHDPGSLRSLDLVEGYADSPDDNEREIEQAFWLAESPTFECYFWEAHYRSFPAARVRLPRLVEMGALDASVLTGGEWTVNEGVRDRVLAAARLVFQTTQLADRRSELLGVSHLSEVEEILKTCDVGWPGRGLVDCLFGNPFAHTPFEPAWAAETATQLAAAIYEEKAWDRLPVLADALEDAGAEGEVLTHLRGGRVHARGCWVVDVVLGKT